MKTRRAIILFLEEEGPSPVDEIAHWLGKEPRVIYNYLRYHPQFFETCPKGWRLKEGIGSSSL